MISAQKPFLNPQIGKHRGKPCLGGSWCPFSGGTSFKIAFSMNLLLGFWMDGPDYFLLNLVVVLAHKETPCMASDRWSRFKFSSFLWLCNYLWMLNANRASEALNFRNLTFLDGFWVDSYGKFSIRYELRVCLCHS